MTEYRLVTVWRFAAPRAAVYAAVCEPLHWPEWWPDARHVVERQTAVGAGVGRLLQCTWQGRLLPYRLCFDLRITRMQAPTIAEGRIAGDLEGCARCRFSQHGTVTTVRHEWRVRTTRRWMNWLARFAHPWFARNHARAMQRGGEGLARRLGVRLLHMEHAELAATPEP